ncbi:alpha/beta fold hydrolase [Pseudonocardia sp. GCM10023141]|uniref:alpha/beta fold hydrolase n=1 Tax=Pseudonocardia sp. GCM10023141 TaxID=3252653 RepID=UPI00360D4E8C
MTPSTGPAVVLLHGGGPGVDAASNWASVRPQLAEHFHCLAPDLLGFGTQIAGTQIAGTPIAGIPIADTADLHGPVAWARARARQVLDLLDEQELTRVHLIGNSAAGGAAALALLATAPERVERAVLMGGAGTGRAPAAVPFYDEPTRESMRATLARLVADESDHEELLDDLADLRLEQALRPGAEQAFRSMFDVDDQPPVDPAAVSTPVLALHGQHDRISPIDVSARLVDALACGCLEVVAGAGHWIHVDRPNEFCNLVREFLNA